MRRIFTTFFALSSAVCLHADITPASKVRSIFRSRPLVFESRDGKTYTSWTPDQRIAVGGSGWDIVLPASSKRIGMSIVGAKASSAQAQTEGPVPTHNVYMHGGKKDWYASKTGYHRVRYPQVLPGIDVAYYGDGQKLEFDLIVKPGADPSAVRLHFSGQDRLEVDDNGELRLYAGGSPIVQKTPAVFQKEAEGLRLVEGRYILRADGDVGFAIGAYDRNLPLVIDPVVDYTLYVGDVAKDVATQIVRDRAGFLYIAGNTLSTSFPVAGQAIQNSANGDVDVFLTKIDPNQTPENAIVYSSFIGGSGADRVSSLMLGPDGYVYLAGTTFSSNFPVANAAYGTPGGKGDGFVLKLDTSVVGTAGLVYSTFLGGTQLDAVTGAVLGSDGSVAVTGYTASTDFPIVGSSYQGTNAGGYDAFVAWFGPGGNLAYSTYIGGDKSDVGQAIALDDDGGFVVAGYTASATFPLAGTPFSSSLKDLSDLFILKLLPTGQLAYSSYFGGSDAEGVNAMVKYATGRFVVTGYTLSSDFPVTSNAAQKTLKGASDAFITIFDVRAAGGSTLVYSTLYGGSDADSGFDVKTDASGLITFAGYTISQDLPVTKDALQTTYQGGGADAFVAQIRPGSPVQFSTYLGGLGTDLIYSIALAPDGRIHLAGSTSSRSLPTGNPARHTGDVADTDAVVLTLSAPQP